MQIILPNLPKYFEDKVTQLERIWDTHAGPLHCQEYDEDIDTGWDE
jgi:hypothetical protein